MLQLSSFLPWNRVRYANKDEARQVVWDALVESGAANDHDTLREDLAPQTAVERDEQLSSSPILCRFESRADRQALWRMHAVLVEQFIQTLQAGAERMDTRF